MRPRVTFAAASAVAVFLVPSVLSAQTARPTLDDVGFVSAIHSYSEFVTPLCAPELVRAYVRVNYVRDQDFERSLEGTTLDKLYRSAKRTAATGSVVRHCDGAPPPPPPPGVANPAAYLRAQVIEIEQKRLREAADRVPRYFDAGDAAFARMVAARDRLLR